ncbi:unnamed protein product [Mucor hiemalis]
MDQFSTDRSLNTLLPTSTASSTFSSTAIQHQSASNQNRSFHNSHHHEDIIVQPVPVPQKSAHANTFVHKLYNMVVDTQFQHSSLGITQHNNFSSFVRQLNMYGFHKVNKSPRGHRTLAENQIWEFSHTKFLRDRPDLLDDIKRKTMETDTVRRETGDLHAHLAMMQVSQSDMLQQINHLYDNFRQIVKELYETRQKQESHHKLVKHIMQYISQQNGGQLPHELGAEYKKLNINSNSDSNNHNSSNGIEAPPPSIFVTTHDQQQQQNMNSNTTNSNTNTGISSSFYDRNSTNSNNNINHNQPLVPSQRSNNINNNLMPSPTFRSTLPPSPCPTMILSSSDDDGNNYYSNNPTPNQHHHILQLQQNRLNNTNPSSNAHSFSFISNGPSMSG